MHQASFELIEIPHVRMSGKNSADIRMVVDALDLCYTKAHVDTFVIISGDSDFSPLVSKLRENDKRVIGVGVKNSTSDLLIANCDEFIYYDDLVRERKQRATRKTAAKKTGVAPAEPAPAADAAPVREAPPARGRKRASKKQSAAVPLAEEAIEPDAPDAPREHDKVRQALDLVMETIEALAAERGGEDKIWGSMVKQALKRVKPGFAESYYGFRSFNALLEEAATQGLVALESDPKSGGYVIRLIAHD